MARRFTLTVENAPPDVGEVIADHFRSTPTSFPYGASVNIDVSENNVHAMSDTLTGDMAITFLGGADGDCGSVLLTQDATGGRKITNITASGRTVLMSTGLGVTLNTEDFLVANAVSELTYEFVSISGTAYVLVSMATFTTASYA